MTFFLEVADAMAEIERLFGREMVAHLDSVGAHEAGIWLNAMFERGLSFESLDVLNRLFGGTL